MSGLGGVRRTDEVWVPIWICLLGHIMLRRAGDGRLVRCGCGCESVHAAFLPQAEFAD